MSKIYAVRKGRKMGIFYTWDECKKSVHGYPGAEYKSFTNIKEAYSYLDITEEPIRPQKEQAHPEKAYAYVDGSYSDGVYGCGGFLVDIAGTEHIIQACGSDPDMASMHNVAGEVLGARLAMEKAAELGMHDLTLYYDYKGIQCWATGEWKRNKQGTKAYHAFYREISKTLNVEFVKVQAHTKIAGNERADRLAKEAVGLN